jgi:hypothetical protein
MNRLRTTPIVVAALALAACVLLVSAEPAQTVPVLDNFNRANEDPSGTINLSVFRRYPPGAGSRETPGW